MNAAWLRGTGILLAAVLAGLPGAAAADGGPLGIDQRWNMDDRGIWSRRNQNLLRYGALIGDLGLALWEGGNSRLGRTAWSSMDSLVLSQLAAEGGKRVFGRPRPRDNADPNVWFERGRSFPSGEVAGLAAIVMPYVVEYGSD